MISELYLIMDQSSVHWFEVSDIAALGIVLDVHIVDGLHERIER